MRIYLTGASGFVGSNLRRVFERCDAEVIAPSHELVDISESATVRRSIDATRPDAIVHAAIWNAPAGLRSDRRRAWSAYVGATHTLAHAANAINARLVLLSTDWVFDGTQGPATETEPPNPINTYGFLKAASELVVTALAQQGIVARVSGVQGPHLARPDLTRSQDAGFGYLVAALTDTLARGERFTIWDGPGLNTVATPTLASDAGERIWRALELGVSGTLHCCGGEHASRVGLARKAIEVFGLDPDLLDISRPPADVFGGEPVPADTRLDASATASRLNLELADLETTLERLRHELTHP